MRLSSGWNVLSSGSSRLSSGWHALSSGSMRLSSGWHASSSGSMRCTCTCQVDSTKPHNSLSLSASLDLVCDHGHFQLADGKNKAFKGYIRKSSVPWAITSKFRWWGPVPLQRSLRCGTTVKAKQLRCGSDEIFL